MAATDTFKILNHPSKVFQKWYSNNYRIAIGGTITFTETDFKIYYPIKTISIKQIEDLCHDLAGFLGIEKWLPISYLERENKKEIRIFCNLFDKYIDTITNRLIKYR